MTDQLAMLKQMFDATKDLQGCSDVEAFDIVLSFIAVNIRLEQQLTTLPMKAEVSDKLNELFDAKLLKEGTEDDLGTLYLLVGLPEPSRIKLPDLVKMDMEIIMRGTKKHEGMPLPMYFTQVDTGRNILYAYDKLGKDAIYYGTETDLRLYRIALLNMHLYDVPAHILYADPDKVDTSIGSKNWRQANVWEPVSPDKLKQA